MRNKKIENIVNNHLYAQGVLVILWLAVQLILFMITGVKIANDSPQYIFHANQVVEMGTLPSGQFFWYLGYIGFLSLFFSLNLGYPFIIAFQVLISGLAMLALYRASIKITKGNYAVGFLAAAFYALWPKIQLWNFYILTDSLFTSMTIISFWALVHIKNWKSILMIVPLFIFSFLLRPNGIGLLVATVAFVCFTAINYNKKLAVKAGILLMPLIVLLGIFLLNRMLSSFTLIETYSRGDVIFLYPETILEEGDSLNLPIMASPISNLIYFIVHNFSYFIKLASLKLGYFFLNMKPYYSYPHNTFLLLLLPIYYFAIKGGFSKSISLQARSFIYTFVTFQALIVMLTVEDWDGRFLVPVLPFIFILSAAGISNFYSKRNDLL